MKIREERNLPADQRFRQVDSRTGIMQHEQGWSPNNSGGGSPVAQGTAGGGRSQAGAGYSGRLGGGSWDQRFAAALQRKYDLMEREQDITADTATRGQDVWSGTTMRGQDIERELGMGELGIKQQDLNLDKAAWDFGMQRYDEFGRPMDRNRLLRDKLATIGESLGMYDLDDESINAMLGRFAGLFKIGQEEGAVESGGVATPPSDLEIPPYLDPNTGTLPGVGVTPPVPPSIHGFNPPSLEEYDPAAPYRPRVRPPSDQEESWLERTFPWAKGYRGENTPSWW